MNKGTVSKILFSFFVPGFASCSAVSKTQFTNPHNFSNMRAKVTLSDNTTVPGYLTLRQTNFENHASIWLPSEGVTKNLSPYSIAAYTTDFGTFHYKTLHPAGRQKQFAAFVKLISNAGDAINIYEYTEYVPGVKSILPNAIKHYYTSLPGEDANHIWDIEGEKLNPRFNETMKKIFATDAAITQKIENKERGYYYKPFSISSPRKLKILLKLNNEFSMHNATASTAAN